MQATSSDGVYCQVAFHCITFTLSEIVFYIVDNNISIYQSLSVVWIVYYMYCLNMLSVHCCTMLHSLIIELLLQQTLVLILLINQHSTLCPFMLRGLEDRGTSPCQVLSKSVNPLKRYCNFLTLPLFCILEIVKFYWLTGSREPCHIT